MWPKSSLKNKLSTGKDKMVWIPMFNDAKKRDAESERNGSAQDLKPGTIFAVFTDCGARHVLQVVEVVPYARS